ncbi:hypothetical protein KEM52_003503 [Ascosphaera acerosa]|nr:hypothetical protein KEM52_003503 [Ascosphaera acerosa]
MDGEGDGAGDDGERAQRFWDGASRCVADPKLLKKLDRVLSRAPETHAEIDEVLREFLELATRHEGEGESTVEDSDSRLYDCLDRLWKSRLFESNADYVRLQFIHCFLQEDNADPLYIFALFLLIDGRSHDETFTTMRDEGAFVHTMKLIDALVHGKDDLRVDLDRILLNLAYEMARIQRLREEDLVSIDDNLVTHLFAVIEQSDGQSIHDPFYYPVIRVLLVLNEQFLLADSSQILEGSDTPSPTNRVIKILSKHGHHFKTFGENIILLLNRESETTLQLLVLKLLYLLFTTPPTYEYFYTNDLHVLVDILVRNLYDLPEEQQSLRHTYLRVLFPLLANTQLKHPPHYKRHEVRKLLWILLRSQLVTEGDHEEILHFGEVDETTRRLVQRCVEIDWLREDDDALSDVASDTAERSSEVASPPLLAETDSSSASLATAATNGIHPITRVATLPARFESASLHPLPIYTGAPSRSPSPNPGIDDLVMAPSPPHLQSRASDTAVCGATSARRKPEPPVSRRVAMQNRRLRELPPSTASTPTPTSRPALLVAEPYAPAAASPPPMSVHSTPTSSSNTRTSTPEPPVSRRMQRAMSFGRPPDLHQSHLHPQSQPQPQPPPPPRPSRAALLQPPAVPPPRRSSHSTPSGSPVPIYPNSRGRPPPIPPVPPRYAHSATSPPASVSGYAPAPASASAPASAAASPLPLVAGHKPEPPVARRSRTRHAHQQQQQQHYVSVDGLCGEDEHAELSARCRLPKERYLSTSLASQASGER